MNYRLSIDRGHLLQGLRLFNKAMRRKHMADRAVFGFSGSYLTVDACEQAFVAQAFGVWPGKAIVSASTLFAMAQVPPDGDPIIVTCDGENFQIGTLKIPCKWQPVSMAILSHPARAEWIDALAMRYQIPRGHLIVERYGPELKQAERKLAALIRRVAKALEPLGVTTADIESLVERRMGERFAGTSAGRTGVGE